MKCTSNYRKIVDLPAPGAAVTMAPEPCDRASFSGRMTAATGNAARVLANRSDILLFYNP